MPRYNKRRSFRRRPARRTVRRRTRLLGRRSIIRSARRAYRGRRRISRNSSSRRSRSRGGLKFSRVSNVNTVARYKVPTRRRRERPASKRMVRTVNEIMNPPIHYGRQYDTVFNWGVNQCMFRDGNIGDSLDNYNLFQDAFINYIAAGNAPTNANLVREKVHVMSAKLKSSVHNFTTDAIHVTFYTCTPRRPIPFNYQNTGVNSPAQLIDNEGQSGSIVANPVTTTVLWPFNDYRFTPFMCPRLTRDYNISNVKHVKIAAGGEASATAVINNYDLSYWLDSNINDPPNFYSRPGKYVAILVKIWGQLALDSVQNNELVNNHGTAVMRNNIDYEFCAIRSTGVLQDTMVQADYSGDVTNIINEQTQAAQVTGQYSAVAGTPA